MMMIQLCHFKWGINLFYLYSISIPFIIHSYSIHIRVPKIIGIREKETLLNIFQKEKFQKLTNLLSQK